MIKAYIAFWKRAFDFKGRSSRPEFWWPFLVNILIGFLYGLLVIAPIIFVTISNSHVNMADSVAFQEFITNTTRSVLSQYMWPVTVFQIVTLIPNISLQLRRLRDAGFHPAWIGLYAVQFIPYISLISGFTSIALIIMSCMPTKNDSGQILN